MRRASSLGEGPSRRGAGPGGREEGVGERPVPKCSGKGAKGPEGPGKSGERRGGGPEPGGLGEGAESLEGLGKERSPTGRRGSRTREIELRRAEGEGQGPREGRAGGSVPAPEPTATGRCCSQVRGKAATGAAVDWAQPLRVRAGSHLEGSDSIGSLVPLQRVWVEGDRASSPWNLSASGPGSGGEERTSRCAELRGVPVERAPLGSAATCPRAR